MLATTLLKNTPSVPGEGAAQVVPRHLPVTVFLLPLGTLRHWDPTIPAPGSQGDGGGDQAGNQGSDQDGDQGENQGDQDGNQDENQDENLGSDQGANQGATKGQPHGAAKGKQQVGIQDANESNRDIVEGSRGPLRGMIQTEIGPRYVDSHVPSESFARQQYSSHYWRWPYITGLRFTELHYYDFRGLCRTIYETITLVDIRYIIGATGEGRKQIRRAPHQSISDDDYLFIQSDIDVRMWLLANPVADVPLDLLLYDERNSKDMMPQTFISPRMSTPAMWSLRVKGEVVSIAVAGEGTQVAGQGSQEAEVIVSRSDLQAPVSVSPTLPEEETPHSIMSILKGPPTLLLPSPDNSRQRKRPAMSDDREAIESEPKSAQIEPSNEASQALPIEVKNIQNDANEGNQDGGDIAAPSEPNTRNTPIPI
ncbi:hypothetical protein HOY80DRAFT_1096845 [Tuber brumale]|nr:hypothetical protein HOY80DRAFT_1096845 [Tuber brumale]